MDWLSWLMEEAKTASPLFAVFALGVGGIAVAVMRRDNQRLQKTIESMGRSQTKAMLAVARNLATLSAKIQNIRR